MSFAPTERWNPGRAPVAVVMISLNEAHNIEAACQSLAGWAQEVFLVDSYSQDDTVEIALRHGVHVVQRAFRGFGDQWNFALSELPISAPWTMKIDPDERLTSDLKNEIVQAIEADNADGISMNRRLWFMGRPLPIRQRLIRAWRSGRCRFSPVAVNEHPIVSGRVVDLKSDIDHHDSPDLDHWLEKQNAYTTAEAIALHDGSPYAAIPRLWGSALQRRMWLKSRFWRVPFRYALLFLYNWLWRGAWRAGWVGFAWARLRSDVMRLIDYKRREMTITGRLPVRRPRGPGKPDLRVRQY
jgi:glycosyltransferase involved in cell wall biosynthesis